MRFARHIFAVASIALLAWGSVVDNPAVCPDETEQQGDLGHRHDAPPSSHCCLTAPCHTPAVSGAVVLLQQPAAAIAASVATPPRVLSSIEAPTPPTPPPTFVA